MNHVEPLGSTVSRQPFKLSKVSIRHKKEDGSVRVFVCRARDVKDTSAAPNGGDVLDRVAEILKDEGWDFSEPKREGDRPRTRMLLLTHRMIGQSLGYPDLARAFRYSDGFAKKEDPCIAYLIDRLEPACQAFEKKRYGMMFELLGARKVKITSHSDKQEWARIMNHVCELRRGMSTTIAQVLAYVYGCGRIPFPDELVDYVNPTNVDEEDGGARKDVISKLGAVPYYQVQKLKEFLDEHTPFQTQHGVKGEQFENVLVVGSNGGWNHYDFEILLTYGSNASMVPETKANIYRRTRNIFYVACSRAMKRLAVLFTDPLSDRAVSTLEDWFGSENVIVL